MAETDLWFGTLSATVRVEDLPASRRVVAIELPANGEWRVCGTGASNADGIAVLPISGLPTSRIYAVAIDEWGRPFVPNMTVSYGDVIRPTQFVGWMYQVTQPGVLPAAEPDWWNAMAGIPQPVGTAMMQAIRHYQPIAHGPVSDIEWVEQEFDPYWDDVVALMRFDEELKDEKGNLFLSKGTRPLQFVGGRFGNALWFDGVNGNQYAKGPAVANMPGANLSGGLFTVEFFVLVPEGSAGTRVPVSSGSNSAGEGIQLSWWCRINEDAVGFTQSSNGSGGTTSSLSGPLVDRGHVGVWTHVAIVRLAEGLTIIFLDGKKVAEGMMPVVWHNTTSGITLGRLDYPSFAYPFLGGVDELRITKGIARYTENFTPPSAPFPNIGPPL